MPEAALHIECCLGKQITVVPEGWHLISTIKHPDLRDRFSDLAAALQLADCVVRSQHDPKVCLYYKKLKPYYLVAVVKHYNGDGFLITAYQTAKYKKGEMVYEKRARH